MQKITAPINEGIIEINGSGFVEGYVDEKEDFVVTPEVRAQRKAVPTHPGEVLRELYLPRTGLSQTALADHLGVSRRTVNEILTAKRPVTVDMAQRFALAFGTTPRFWLNLQLEVDLWEAKNEHASEYQNITRLAA